MYKVIPPGALAIHARETPRARPTPRARWRRHAPTPRALWRRYEAARRRNPGNLMSKGKGKTGMTSIFTKLSRRERCSSKSFLC